MDSYFAKLFNSVKKEVYLVVLEIFQFWYWGFMQIGLKNDEN